MRKFIITEERLKNLLVSELELLALHSGGVDNWEWYSESLSNYLEDLLCDDFEDEASCDIDNYPEYKD